MTNISPEDLQSILLRISALELAVRRPRAEVPVAAAFTPTYFGQTTPGTTTYTTQVGRYANLGDILAFGLYLHWSAATGTGNALVGGFPLLARNVTSLHVPINIWYSQVTYAAGTGLQAIIRPNTQQAELWYSPASNVAAGQIAVEASGELIMGGFYFL